jgi:hypothetical protein
MRTERLLPVLESLALKVKVLPVETLRRQQDQKADESVVSYVP